MRTFVKRVRTPLSPLKDDECFVKSAEERSTLFRSLNVYVILVDTPNPTLEIPIFTKLAKRVQKRGTDVDKLRRPIVDNIYNDPPLPLPVADYQ